jgi:hypothetical protein
MQPYLLFHNEEELFREKYKGIVAAFPYFLEAARQSVPTSVEEVVGLAF